MRGFSVKARAQRLAGNQGGRITWAQLLRVGLTRHEADRWIRSSILTRTRPKVYALGYVRTDHEAVLWEAILYAGPGAYLNGACGSHHLGLIRYPPAEITVATPWRRTSQPGIIVLRSRPDIRQINPATGIPIAPLPELMLELAAEGDYALLRFALANLEYRRQLDIAALLAVCARGRAGAALLRHALEHRLPQLARTRSELEIDFLLLLEAHHLSLPQVNRKIHGLEVDAYWPKLQLVIELDGEGNHGTAAQKRWDEQKTARLSAQGLTVRRFNWNDVHDQGGAKTVVALAELGVRHG